MVKPNSKFTYSDANENKMFLVAWVKDLCITELLHDKDLYILDHLQKIITKTAQHDVVYKALFHLDKHRKQLKSAALCSNTCAGSLAWQLNISYMLHHFTQK